MGLWNWLTGLDTENVAAGERADAQNAAINQRLLESGSMSQSEFDQAQQHLNASAMTVEQAEAEVNRAALEGLREGASAEIGLITKPPLALADGILAGLFRSIPWWLWLVGGIALFVWLGGQKAISLRFLKNL